MRTAAYVIVWALAAIGCAVVLRETWDFLRVLVKAIKNRRGIVP